MDFYEVRVWTHQHVIKRSQTIKLLSCFEARILVLFSIFFTFNRFKSTDVGDTKPEIEEGRRNLQWRNLTRC